MKSIVSLELRLLLALASGTTLLVFPFFTDPVNLPKFILLMSTAFSLAFFAGVHKSFMSINSWSRNYLLGIKKNPLTFILVLFLLGMLVSSLFSQSPLTGIFGLSGRRNGLLTYLALFFLFLVAQKFGSRISLVHFMRSLATAGSIQSIFMLVQYVNLDPLPWDAVYENRMFGTLGNPNFSSAFLAMSFPALVFCAAAKSTPLRLRIYFKISMFTSLLAMILAGVYQGPLSLLIAGSIVLFAFVNLSNLQRNLKSISITFFLAATASLILGILKIGPLGSVFSKYSFELRFRGYWPTAAEIGFSNPIFGVGQEQFVNYFPRTFDPGYRLKFGEVVTDNAHNHFFHFFAEGGLTVLLPYLIFLGLTSVFTFRLCARTKGDERFLALAALGVWFAFIGQAMVSVDNLGLSIWAWILAGLIAGFTFELNSLTKEIDSIQKKNVRTDKVKQKEIRTRRPKIAIFASLFTLTFFTQLALLDNKIWMLESVGKQGSTLIVTEADLETLVSRTRYWPLDPTLLSRSSSLLLTFGRTEQGFSLLNRAIILNPDSPSVLNLRAVATESILNRNLAATMRARELEMDPWNQGSSIEYIRDLLEQRNISAAKRELERLQKFGRADSIAIANNIFVAAEGQ
jgi:hypothetical protein